MERKTSFSILGSLRPFGRLTPVNVGPECISPNLCFKYLDLGSFKNMFVEGWWGLTRFAGLMMHWKWKERSLLYILFPFKRLFKEGRWVANPLERGKTRSRSLSWQIHRRALQIILHIILQIIITNQPEFYRQIILQIILQIIFTSQPKIYLQIIWQILLQIFWQIILQINLKVIRHWVIQIILYIN